MTHRTSYFLGWLIGCGADKNTVKSTENLKYVTCKDCVEFKVGQTVTLDRYNHIDDVEKVKVVGYGEMPISGTLTYKMDVNGVIIESTGISIMESKDYEPCPDEDRHYRKNATPLEIEQYWDKKFNRKTC